MTTTTPSLTRSRLARPVRARGFTLVEVIIGATLAGFILTAILTAFLFLGRSGANLQNYTDMESQGRRALERFAEDVRQASAISWGSATSVTLTVNATAITYAYNAGAGTFTRQTGGATTTLINGIISGSFAFKAYNVSGTELPLSTSAQLTAAGINTKQLQLSLKASRTTRTVARATNLVLSARFILRNKIVTA